jgi:hypothetical protein
MMTRDAPCFLPEGLLFEQELENGRGNRDTHLR